MKKQATFTVLPGLALLGFILSVWAQFTKTPAKQPSPHLTSKSEVSIMTYNVENLFDTKDDPKKNDETFLPLVKKRSAKVKKKCKQAAKPHWVKECLSTNWNQFKLDLKIKRLSKVILAANPDTLILQEVENKGVLEELNKVLGYPTLVLLEGPDKRGIDIGLLSRLPLKGGPKLHHPKRNYGAKPKRAILEVPLELPDGTLLSVLGLHFPSQGSRTPFRKAAVKQLNDILKNKPPHELIVAGGDFNITSSEERKYNFFKNTLGKRWLVSHLIGCKKCKGTNYYHPKRSWSFFDALLFSPSLKKGKWSLDPKSIEVFNKVKIQNNRHGSPARFQMGEHRQGISDHWPVKATIKFAGKD